MYRINKHQSTALFPEASLAMNDEKLYFIYFIFLIATAAAVNAQRW